MYISGSSWTRNYRSLLYLLEGNMVAFNFHVSHSQSECQGCMFVFQREAEIILRDDTTPKTRYSYDHHRNFKAGKKSKKKSNRQNAYIKLILVICLCLSFHLNK